MKNYYLCVRIRAPNGKSEKSPLVTIARLNWFPYFTQNSVTIWLSKVFTFYIGNYNIIPTQYNWQQFKWYVDKVPGRTGIAIHRGTSGENTEGCLMPGTEFYYDRIINDYKLKGSRNKEKELFDFFGKYGQNGIRINIGI